MNNVLPFARGLSLPIDAVTQTLAFIGKKGSGKTYASTKLAELFLEAGAQIVALDPVGLWHGLRQSGTGNAFDIPIFGGRNGDLPLSPGSGALVADLIVDRGISAVLDTSQMLGSEQSRFAKEFAAQFFLRRKEQPQACHVFLEEAQEYCPQNIVKGDIEGAMMLHHFERMVKLGRNFGIGVSMISQQPQSINKKVLNQTECLLAFQLTGTHERKAVAEWVGEKGLDVKLADELPYIKQGQPHIWSPAWLEVSGVYQVLPKQTADVSQTPVLGSAPAQPKALTPIDLKALEGAMAAAQEEAKANDPKELKARIAELEKQVKVGGGLTQADIDNAVADRTAQLVARLDQAQALNESARDIAAAILAMAQRFGELMMPVVRNIGEAVERSLPPVDDTPTPSRAAVATGTRAEAKLQSMLDVLAELASLGMREVDKRTLAVLTDQSPKSSQYDGYLRRLRMEGLIGTAGAVSLRSEGKARARKPGKPPTLQDLHRTWRKFLSRAAGRCLDPIVKLHPRPVMRAEVASLSGISPTSSSFDGALRELRSFGLIVGSKEMSATALLFPEGLR